MIDRAVVLIGFPSRTYEASLSTAFRVLESYDIKHLELRYSSFAKDVAYDIRDLLGDMKDKLGLEAISVKALSDPEGGEVPEIKNDTVLVPSAGSVVYILRTLKQAIQEDTHVVHVLFGFGPWEGLFYPLVPRMIQSLEVVNPGKLGGSYADSDKVLPRPTVRDVSEKVAEYLCGKPLEDSVEDCYEEIMGKELKKTSENTFYSRLKRKTWNLRVGLKALYLNSKLKDNFITSNYFSQGVKSPIKSVAVYLSMSGKTDVTADLSVPERIKYGFCPNSRDPLYSDQGFLGIIIDNSKDTPSYGLCFDFQTIQTQYKGLTTEGSDKDLRELLQSVSRNEDPIKLWETLKGKIGDKRSQELLIELVLINLFEVIRKGETRSRGQTG